MRIQSSRWERGPLVWPRVFVIFNTSALQIEHVLNNQDGPCSEEEQGYVPMWTSNDHHSIFHRYHLLCLNGLAGRLVKRCCEQR